MFSRTHNRRGILAALGLALVIAAVAIQGAGAALQLGSAARDVIFGRDNDNAENTFIQPAGVAAKQHLDNTDVVLGGSRGDVLVGLKGNDLIDGGSDDDVLIGGVEKGAQPNSDLLSGGYGNDVNIWAPGDGSDAFLGGPGYDTHISAPLVLDETGTRPALFPHHGRQLPHVSIDSKPQFTCTIEAVPAERELGFEYITRFLVNGNLAVTIRLQDVEQVLCPSPNPGKVLVAELGGHAPAFVERPLSQFAGTGLGSILQAPAQ
jgi:hemolysin type calcium-binding protein